GRLADAEFTPRLKERLRKADCQAVEAEQALLTRALASERKTGGRKAQPVASTPGTPRKPGRLEVPEEEIAENLFLCRDATGLHLRGAGLTPEVEARVRLALMGVR